MRKHIVYAPIVVLLVLAGCQTTGNKPGSDKAAQAQGATSQSDKLAKLATDIEAHGDDSTAIALYERATAMPDARASTFAKAGEAYLKAGYPERAVKAYQAALARAPNDGPAMLGLGSAMIEAGDVDAGIRALAQAVPIVNTGNAYNRLGVAQTFAGQVDAAQATFAQALTLSPGDLDVEINMALAAALKGDAATAVPLVQKVAASPNVQLLHKRNIVVVYGLLGQQDQVRAAPPVGLSTKEIKTLLAKAKAIRAKGSVLARAKALGSIYT
jgi:Flp pilus assembly protein TadD